MDDEDDEERDFFLGGVWPLELLRALDPGAAIATGWQSLQSSPCLQEPTEKAAQTVGCHQSHLAPYFLPSRRHKWQTGRFDFPEGEVPRESL